MDNEKQSESKLLFAFIISIIAISSSAILVKGTTAPSAIAATYRMLFTVILFLPWTIKYHFNEIKQISRKDLIFSIVSGVFLAFHFLSWFESLRYTSIASSVVLVTVQPIFSMLGLYIFFKERYRSIAIFGTLLAIIGSIIIGWGDFALGNKALYGDMLALLGALMVTVYWIFGQVVRRKLSLLTYTTLVYSSAAFTLIIYDLIFNYSFFHYTLKDWGIFIGLAIIPNIFGHTILNWAVKYVNATTISMTILGEPIGASILAYIVYDEVLNTKQWMGGALILIGLFVYNRYKSEFKLTEK